MKKKSKKDKEFKKELKNKEEVAKGDLQEKLSKMKKGDFVHPKKRKKFNFKYVRWFLVAVILWAGIFYFTITWMYLAISFVFLVGLFQIYFFAKKKLRISERIKKMEEVFPDFISLMASNLRAGMTIDHSLILSSRSEFAPLDKEIMQTGKDIVTGKKVNVALNDMAKRINSDKISKTITLITSGMSAGGNLSVLLEETATYMRERNFVEKRAASNVLMYVIFIFFAVAIGAPLLFGLSSVLVEILTGILSNLPSQQVQVNLPFTLTEINISVNFVVYFSILFVIVTDILASMVLGLVSRGKEREGIRFVLPLIFVSLAVFFVSRIVILKYFSGVFA
ncbi:MAG: type II secretion system F family protein [Nanoarchaeota archaeon]|nr:type II secretion system F family protein [Nanoarchaeota archaeon]MBU1051828.1 type II secretion system F family protein [Nanoarchaeota archaeon]MBU1988441.1 type II secretion system F family protein [Nanoarchaeota archaeon]